MSQDLDSQTDADQDSSVAADLSPDLSEADLRDPQVFGKLFIDSIYKIMKVASIYNVEHNQTRIAVDEFMATFREAVRHTEDGSISVVIRGELAIVNGETLRLRRRAQKRLNELHDLFAAATIRGLVLEHGLQTDHLVRFLAELKRASAGSGEMKGVEVPSIRIEHGSPARTIREALSSVNKSMYVAHVYIRGLVKTRNAHKTVRERQSADIPTGVIRRIMQSISELLGDEDFTILGLLPLRMVPPDLSSHSFNSAIYAMLLADRLGLSSRVVSYVGMAVIYQDLDRLVGISVGQRDQEGGLDDKQQFQSNLRDVAKMLERVQGDIISTLRILLTYERGCDFNKAVDRPFYRAKRSLHLVTRIIDLARTYDLLIQGLQGYKQRRPDLAIQYVQSRAGQSFDETLTELLVSTLGIYPIGTTIQLTSGENAIVIRTPAPSADPRRPVVRLLDRANPTVIDLSEPRFADIEIAHSIDLEADEVNAASEVFLLS
jgi:HD-GYP domain-containing protein (c-di-GMP phosphodiesterase class II)